MQVKTTTMARIERFRREVGAIREMCADAAGPLKYYGSRLRLLWAVKDLEQCLDDLAGELEPADWIP
jgi:hypothetical protein